MELTLLDYDMVHYRPSEVAAAALCLSQLLLNGLSWVSPTSSSAAVLSAVEEVSSLSVPLHVSSLPHSSTTPPTTGITWSPS